MAEPELRPLIGARVINLSEDPVVTNIIENILQNADTGAMEPAAESPKPVISMQDPDSITEHPISQGLAHDVCDRMVGIGSFRVYRRWIDILPVWWERLRSAPTPEERLSCERMINALNRAAGMHMTERSTKLIARNRQRWEQEQADAAAAEKAAEESAAINRWRYVGVVEG